jgi:hypothetical protein
LLVVVPLTLGFGQSTIAQESGLIEADEAHGALDRALGPLRPAMDACIFPDGGSGPATPGTVVLVWQVDDRGDVSSDTRVTPTNAQIEACLQAVATRVDLSAFDPGTRVETRLEFNPGAVQREREVYDLETGEAVVIDVRAGLGRDWDRTPSRVPVEALAGPADSEDSRMDIERVLHAATPYLMPCFADGRSNDATRVTVAIAVDSAGPPTSVEARGQTAETAAAQCIVARLGETLFDAPRAGGVDAYWTFSAPRLEALPAESGLAE